MSRNKIELAVGIIIAALPFIGFPTFADKLILICAGVLLCALGVFAHVQAKSAAVVRHQREINGQL